MDNKGSIELKPCPFCGAEVSIAAMTGQKDLNRKAMADIDKSGREKAWRYIKKAMLLCIPMLFLAVVIKLTTAFVPSTKQMAAIIVVPKIANSEKVQTVGNKLYDLAVEWMDELKPAIAKEGGAK